MNYALILYIVIWFCTVCKSNIQAGPDPWHYESVNIPGKFNENDLPPDLRIPLRTERQTENKLGFGEWWFKRLLAIMLKSGQLKTSEDGGVDVSLQMRFDGDKWGELVECLKSDAPLTDVMFRRAVGYVEEAIYKPTITDQIVMAWTDYIQVYLIEYKMYISLLFGALGAVGLVIWLWRHISHKHVIIIVFVLLYIYEVIISYKEAEQQDYERFVSAVNTCKWYFWTKECTVPPPDPILFMKHMNPMKIAIRMFTSLISEPILALNSSIKIIIQGVTDGLLFPFDKIVYVLLVIFVNLSLIYLLVMVVFNFIFNIPFSLSIPGISIGVKQRRRSLFNTNQQQPQVLSDTDRISGDRLDRLLNVCSIALTNVQTRMTMNTSLTNNDNVPKLKRSASTGRLPNTCFTEAVLPIKEIIRKRQHVGRGEGDH